MQSRFLFLTLHIYHKNVIIKHTIKIREIIMSLRKNSTDKRKYVFYTQLEKGDFSIFEEYDLNEVLETFRTTEYYPFDAILKYFGTLNDKKNGSEIFKEKLQYLKDKGLNLSKVFNVEKYISASNGKVENVEYERTPMNRIFFSRERHKENIYPILFKEIINELINSDKMPISLEEIVKYKVYRDEKFFFSDFIKELFDSEKHSDQFTKKAVEGILSLDLNNYKPLQLRMYDALDIYLTNNPDDKEIWYSILKKGNELYNSKFSALLKKHMFSREDKDLLIKDILRNTVLLNANEIPYHLKINGYDFSNQNLEGYYDIENINHKMVLFENLIDADIAIENNARTKEEFKILLINEKMDKKFSLTKKMNKKLGNPYSLSTVFDNGKSLFEIEIDKLNPIIKKEARGTEVERLPEKYIRVASDINYHAEDLIKNFYKGKDENDFNLNETLKNINIYLIPSIIKKMLIVDPEKSFTFDVMGCFNQSEELSDNSTQIEISKKIKDVIYSTMNHYYKYFDDIPKAKEELKLDIALFYNNFIKGDMHNGSSFLLEEKVNVQMNLFFTDALYNILEKEQRLDFAKIVVRNTQSLLSEKSIDYAADMQEKISKIEKFILKNEVFKEDMPLTSKTRNRI